MIYSPAAGHPPNNWQGAGADIAAVYFIRRVLISADYNARLVLPEQEKSSSFSQRKYSSADRLKNGSVLPSVRINTKLISENLLPFIISFRGKKINNKRERNAKEPPCEFCRAARLCYLNSFFIKLIIDDVILRIGLKIAWKALTTSDLSVPLSFSISA